MLRGMDWVYLILYYAGAAILVGVIVIALFLIAAMILTGIIGLIGSIILRRQWMPPWTDMLGSMMDDF